MKRKAPRGLTPLILLVLAACGGDGGSSNGGTGGSAKGGSHGEDPFPWLTEVVAYVLLAMLALAVVGALWRCFARPATADLARERSMRRLSRREEKARRRPQP